ncbi:uncharacterized protein LOC127786746 isoform X2 [Diospyros lotus]|uniref:uncharacterized protein LOC127786746 isoform X2 n=1 Tax=Diospyros lotus TaxID=55363 RepID=UPI00225A544E|nr:uncharacterized protein LOC127786746 isoform X2 [Diospyros lotus]
MKGRFLLSVALSFYGEVLNLERPWKQPEKKFIPPNKNTTKMSVTQSKVGYGHSLVKQTRVREDDRRPPVSTSSKAKDQLGLQVSGALRPLSVDFSHCVAHCRKRGEQKLGFNADYSVPRTHPPVHN